MGDTNVAMFYYATRNISSLPPSNYSQVSSFQSSIDCLDSSKKTESLSRNTEGNRRALISQYDCFDFPLSQRETRAISPLEKFSTDHKPGLETTRKVKLDELRRARYLWNARGTMHLYARHAEKGIFERQMKRTRGHAGHRVCLPIFTRQTFYKIGVILDSRVSVFRCHFFHSPCHIFIVNVSLLCLFLLYFRKRFFCRGEIYHSRCFLV
mgnify:CR=1 FL=1